MKKWSLLVVLALLSGCTSPDYATQSKETPIAVEQHNTEVARFNGHIIEVTEDNVVRVKVARPNEAVEQGLQLNPDGILDVSLALIDIPMLSAAEGSPNVINDLLKGHLTGQSGDFELVDATTALISLNQRESIQEMLISNGLAYVIDPSINKNLVELEKAAQNNEVGIWALNEFQVLMNNNDVRFKAAAKITESELNNLVNHLDSENWSFEGAVMDMIDSLKSSAQ